jgi:hypothetical protein
MQFTGYERSGLFLKAVKKVFEKSLFGVDVHQWKITMVSMIIEEIRKQIKTSGKSLNQIGRETGIDKAALCRIMQGGSCKVETAEQAKSISATISVLRKMIHSNIRRANQEGRDSTEIRTKRLDQLQRMIDRMRD